MPSVKGDGTVQFTGTFTSLSWTNRVRQGYYGSAVRVMQAQAPVPQSYALMLTDQGALGLTARRRAA